MAAPVKRVASQWTDAEGVYLLMHIEDGGSDDIRDACLRRIERLRRSLLVESAWRLAGQAITERAGR